MKTNLPEIKTNIFQKVTHFFSNIKTKINLYIHKVNPEIKIMEHTQRMLVKQYETYFSLIMAQVESESEIKFNFKKLKITQDALKEDATLNANQKEYLTKILVGHYKELKVILTRLQENKIEENLTSNETIEKLQNQIQRQQEHLKRLEEYEYQSKKDALIIENKDSLISSLKNKLTEQENLNKSVVEQFLKEKQQLIDKNQLYVDQLRDSVNLQGAHMQALEETINGTELSQALQQVIKKNTEYETQLNKLRLINEALTKEKEDLNKKVIQHSEDAKKIFIKTSSLEDELVLYKSLNVDKQKDVIINMIKTIEDMKNDSNKMKLQYLEIVNQKENFTKIEETRATSLDKLLKLSSEMLNPNQTTGLIFPYTKTSIYLKHKAEYMELSKQYDLQKSILQEKEETYYQEVIKYHTKMSTYVNNMTSEFEKAFKITFSTEERLKEYLESQKLLLNAYKPISEAVPTGTIRRYTETFQPFFITNNAAKHTLSINKNQNDNIPKSNQIDVDS